MAAWLRVEVQAKLHAFVVSCQSRDIVQRERLDFMTTSDLDSPIAFLPQHAMPINNTCPLICTCMAK